MRRPFIVAISRFTTLFAFGMHSQVCVLVITASDDFASFILCVIYIKSIVAAISLSYHIFHFTFFDHRCLLPIAYKTFHVSTKARREIIKHWLKQSHQCKFLIQAFFGLKLKINFKSYSSTHGFQMFDIHWVLFLFQKLSFEINYYEIFRNKMHKFLPINHP